MLTLQDRINAEQRMACDPGPILRLTFVQADGAQTYQMVPGQQFVYINSGHSSNTMTITLPPVHECKGQLVYIKAIAGNTATTTVQDDGDDAGFSNISLDGANEFTLLLSTGEEWIEVATIGNS